jgi:hypothetical protein
MTLATLTRLLAATAVAASFLALPAAAQNQSPPAPQEAPAKVSDGELKAFADAAVEVQKIRDNWHPRIQAAPDAKAGDELRQQAQAEMVSAVEAKGLTVEKYQEIYQLAQIDPDVRQKVVMLIEQSK